MKLRRILSLLLVLFLIAGMFSACGRASTGGEDGAGQSAADADDNSAVTSRKMNLKMNRRMSLRMNPRMNRRMSLRMNPKTTRMMWIIRRARS